MDASVSIPPVAPVPQARVHLKFLDGLRGLAALYVVIGHTYGRVLFTRNEAPVPSYFHHLTNWMGYAHYAVAIFIVLSGYCLMLPVVRSSDGALRGGVWGFVRRRARRILPPYYMALLGAALLVYAGLRVAPPEQRGKLLQHLSPGSIVSHLLMLHQFSPTWSKMIDPPMWTVGVEWTIYFIFALLLLPLYRRFGMVAAGGTALFLGVAPYYFLSYPYNLDWACPWYLSLFALGMGGAVLNFSPRYAGRPLNRPTVWASVTAVSVVAFIALTFLMPRIVLGGMIGFQPDWFPDFLVGIAAIGLIGYCTTIRLASPSNGPVLLRILESRMAVSVGAFSYSLYLIHQPLIEGLYQVFRRFHLTPLPTFAVFFIVVIPFVMGLTYLFHRAFERPFMTDPVLRAGKQTSAPPVSA